MSLTPRRPQRALREVAREFVNDSDVIMRPLDDPRLPLTHHAAKRQLRHYAIARRISCGTRTLMGSNSEALLASVIDTCRLRGASATALLTRAIHAVRTSPPASSLPPIPAHLLYRAALAEAGLDGGGGSKRLPLAKISKNTTLTRMSNASSILHRTIKAIKKPPQSV